MGGADGCGSGDAALAMKKKGVRSSSYCICYCFPIVLAVVLQMFYILSPSNGLRGPHVTVVPKTWSQTSQKRPYKQVFSKKMCLSFNRYFPQTTHCKIIYKNDCGLYTMLYMESWNGKKTDTKVEPHMMGNCKELVAATLLLSSNNEISITEFVDKYCNQEEEE